MKALQINASIDTENSFSKSAGKQIENLLLNKGITTTTRNLVEKSLFLGPEFLTWGPETQAQDNGNDVLLKHSSELISELKSADYLILSTPMYNFGPPASLKAWADLVARAGITFTYTEKGPVGLVENIKKAFVVCTSGGVEFGSEYDLLTPWIKTFLGFLNITNVEFLSYDKMVTNQQSNQQKLEADLKKLQDNLNID